MATNEELCYVYTQLPGAFQGTVTYGKSYLTRPKVVELDTIILP